jgi:hypothetical protein
LPGICLVAAGTVVHLGVSLLTLAWTHSVEKIRWEEDYRATPAGLVVTEDRLQGTGAGMEPPPDATFDGTWWRYHPKIGPQPQVILRRSGMTVGDWQVCIGSACKPMGHYVGEKADPVVMKPCKDSQSSGSPRTER